MHVPTMQIASTRGVDGCFGAGTHGGDTDSDSFNDTVLIVIRIPCNHMPTYIVCVR